MNRIRSLDDLKQLRDQFQTDLNIRENSNRPLELPQIRVAMGTCGIAAGAKKTLSAFLSQLELRHIEAVVTQTGCRGRCDAEPVVEVELPGQSPVLFSHVTAERAAEIIEQYIIGGQIVGELLSTQP